MGPFDIPAPGYVYIYVNDNSPNWVHFDDLKITHVHSPFVSGAVYYPFGLTMSDREILTEPYRFGYQGQYAEEETETGWNSFDLRMYDARFGRWLIPDPYGQFSTPYLGMGNDPVIRIDPNGGFSPGDGLWKWISTPSTLNGAEGFFKRTVIGKTFDVLQQIGSELALKSSVILTKVALSSIARAKSEIDFVKANFHKTEEYSLDTDYGRNFYDSEINDLDGFYGFTESGVVDTRKFLGKNDLFGSTTDPVSGISLNVNYYGGWGGTVNKVSPKKIFDPFNDAFTGGDALEFYGGGLGRLWITFKDVHTRNRFMKEYFDKPYKAKTIEMEKKYRLLGKDAKGRKLNKKK